MKCNIFGKRILFLGGFLMAAMLFLQPTFAYSIPKTIRIGLESSFKNPGSISIGNTSILVGNTAEGEFFEGGSINSNGGFVVEKDLGSYIKLEHSFSSYRQALECADEYKEKGFSAVPAYLGEELWSVYILGSSVAEVEDAGDYDASKAETSAERIIIKSGREAVAVSGDGVILQITAEDNQGIVKLGDKQYRGALELQGSASGIIVVNELPLEEYLYGVIAAEMPASYHEEALKAQAIAARTYAITKIGCHPGKSYELCDSIHCQVYQGVSAETERTIAAVDKTCGELAYYNDKPIEALFYASSGGYTENSENVWGNKVDYLRAVPEIAEAGDNNWEKIFTAEQITSQVTAKGDTIGQVRDIVITKIAPGGRILELKIIGSSGEKVLSKDAVRTYFSLPSKLFTINQKGGGVISTQQNSVAANSVVSAQSDSNSIVSSIATNGIVVLQQEDYLGENGQRQEVSEIKNTSEEKDTKVSRNSFVTTNTEVQNVSISTATGGGTFVFQGAGNGHGVGLSQKGAQGMALQGYNYEEILKHYYQGIDIK
ncbi:MAG: SpoIID/LytB domain-containing protein [Epulopiscium sp.]|jgi:stage II sporulation protein D|nr:SpoIID/LytB domain-containing protein [Candidatus Epulonipiscium sp.]